jgi:hypothetical protein
MQVNIASQDLNKGYLKTTIEENMLDPKLAIVQKK